MAEWMSISELEKMLDQSHSTIRRMIQAGHYEGIALITRQVKALRGKPAYQILWNTTTNQPAAAEGVNDVQINPAPVSRPDRPIVVAGGADMPGTGTAGETARQADNLVAPPVLPKQTANKARGVKPEQPKAQAAALQTGARMAIAAETLAPVELPPSLIVDNGLVIDSETGEVATDNIVAAYFENRLWLKVKDKPASTARSLRAYYRKQFQQTGKVPMALCVKEGRRYAGKRRQISRDIETRFVDMVIRSADSSDIFNYYTQDQRKVTVFQRQLEKEFSRKIPIHQLYTVVRACNLAPYLSKQDDEIDDEKTPGFFKAEPVGALVQMDGVEADYLEIQDGDRWRKPIWIEFMDMGSRKLLAMHAYLSESSENSVDIFMRFLDGNAFAHAPMKIRPDNAGGFLNLKRPLHELNKKYARDRGFIFLDDFSRAGTPKDKAHLESSHRKAHKDLERGIINHFKDRIHSQYKKQKKVGNRMKTVTVTRLSISLDELNASGETEAYMRRHNSEKHRFTEDGVQRIWAPADRWDAYITASDTFKFKTKDIELCRRYGYTKAKATIDKNGCITYQKRKYYVADQSHWNRQSSTSIKVSLIGDHLAYFSPHDDGEWLGDAQPLKTPEKSQKIIDREQAKVVKIITENEFANTVKALKDHGMIVDEGCDNKGGKLRKMLDEGLTLDGVNQLLAEHGEKYRQYAGTIVAFNLFASHVKKWQGANNPKKLIPYADGVKKDD